MAKIYVRYVQVYKSYETHFGAFDTDQIRAEIPEFKDHTDEQLAAMLQDSDYALEMVGDFGEHYRVDDPDSSYVDPIVSTHLSDLDLLPDPRAGAYQPKWDAPTGNVEKLCKNPPSLELDSQDGERFLEEIRESHADKREPEAREDSGA